MAKVEKWRTERLIPAGKARKRPADRPQSREESGQNGERPAAYRLCTENLFLQYRDQVRVVLMFSGGYSFCGCFRTGISLLICPFELDG